MKVRSFAPGILLLALALLPGVGHGQAKSYSKEEQQGCGPEQEHHPEAVAHRLCLRYHSLKKMYGGAFDSTMGLPGELKACEEWGRVLGRSRNVMCAYYIDSSALAEAMQNAKPKIGVEGSEDGQRKASEVARIGAAMHEKYRNLLVTYKGELLTKHLQLQDAFKPMRERAKGQVYGEAVSCNGGEFSSIPGPWMGTVSLLTKNEADVHEEKFREAINAALKHSGAQAAALGGQASVTSSNADRMRSIPEVQRSPAPEPDPKMLAPYSPDSLAEELAWGQATNMGTDGIEKLVGKVSWPAAATRFGTKFGGPLLGVTGSLFTDSVIRQKDLNLPEVLNAMCGIFAPWVGVACTVVITGLDNWKKRLNAYNGFAYKYLSQHHSASSREVSKKFCEAIESYAKTQAEAQRVADEAEQARRQAAERQERIDKPQRYEDAQRIVRARSDQERQRAIEEYQRKWGRQRQQ